MFSVLDVINKEIFASGTVHLRVVSYCDSKPLQGMLNGYLTCPFASSQWAIILQTL